MTLFSVLADASAALKETRSRKAKVAALAEALRALASDERRLGASFLAGELPMGKIGVGPALVWSLKDTPAASASSLTLIDVERALLEIADISGKGSKARREAALAALLQRATSNEQALLAGVLTGDLRQGALEGVLQGAIAEAADVPLEAVRRAAMLSGDLARVAQAALDDGARGLAAFRLELFCPLSPMLAQTAGDADALLAQGPVAAELKLDGARVQVHKDGDRVRVYTRQLHEVTARVPEVVEVVRALPAKTLVVDGEALALAVDGRPLPFQTTMRRFGRKKADLDALRQQLPLSVRFFDVLHADGDDVLDQSGRARAAVLDALLPAELRVERRMVASEDDIDTFFAEAIERGHEGLMLKSLEATYEAGRRGKGWQKLKPTHALDLVVLGAEWGSGRREGFLSNLHLAARSSDPQTPDAFVMVGKTFKGLTDQLLAWQTDAILAREVGRDAYTVFAKPELVVEIACDGVQQSPQYPGGVALRFARVRHYRNDKAARDASTIDDVRALWAG